MNTTAEKLALTRSHAAEVSTLTEQLTLFTKKTEQAATRIDELIKQLDQATRIIEKQQAVIAFAKAAELDLVNRLRDLAMNTNLRIESAEKENQRTIKVMEKALEDTLLELKTLKYKFRQVSKS